MSQNVNQQVFFALLRAGLWADIPVHGEGVMVNASFFEGVDWGEVYRMAEEQSVVGLVSAGLDWFKVHDSRFKVPQTVVLQFVDQTLQIEQRNKAMNAFVAELIEKLRKEDVYALLVKGQGIAQCYERPLWRVCGDVDLFLSEENYRKASKILAEVAFSVDEENEYNRHIAMTIDGWVVELHGTLHSRLSRRVDNVVDEVQETVFKGGSVRSWQNGGTQVFVPGVNEDVIFVFSHILQHFYKEGIGLRQICDWCRLLWTYRESLNHGLLESRIKKAGVMTERKSFAALAVDYLGMPVEAMPLYSEDSKWSLKARKVMDFILETGNFGHNRDYSYYQKYPYVVFKAISLWRHIKDFGRYFVIFPLDAIKVTLRRICVGMAVAIKGKRHE